MALLESPYSFRVGRVERAEPGGVENVPVCPRPKLCPNSCVRVCTLAHATHMVLPEVAARPHQLQALCTSEGRMYST